MNRTLRKPMSLCLLGGGGHAVVVAEAARMSGCQIKGFYDDNSHGLMETEAQWLGPLQSVEHANRDTRFILAIGSLEVRRNWLQHLGDCRTTVLHPSAIISQQARLGDGCFVGAGAIVASGVTIGYDAIVNSRAVVEHHCHVGNNVHIAPGAVLGGGVSVDSHVLVGINASVLPGVSIGACATIGAGAVVVENVRAGTTVVGVPARPIAQNSPHRRAA